MQFDYSSTPKLWFKRVVLFKSLHPTVIIRDIELHRGLNIIVGQSSPDTALMNNPMAMAGHSVGKTTFCRLLRYCLDERHFSTENGEQHLRSSLPYSWVGAELEIDGTPWAVLRPLGAQKAPASAQKDASIEELTTTAEKGSGYFEFRQELDKLLPLTVHHPEINYKWEHLLAWMTRDQECRLRKFEVWRDSDSGSDAPGFRKPKEYPIQLVRGVLDLLVPEESEWSHTLSGLTKRQANLKEEQHGASQDADYFYRDASKRLAEFVGEFPDTRTEVAPRLDGPVMLAETYKAKLRAQYESLEQQFEEADKNFRDNQRYVDNALARKRQIDALSIATPPAPAPQPQKTKAAIEYEKKQKELAEITAHVDGGGECLLVDQMPLTQCSHLAAHIEDLRNFKPVLSLPAERQKQAIAAMDEKQREKIQIIIKQQATAQAALDEAMRQAEIYNSKRRDVLKDLYALEKEIDRLDSALNAFQHAERLGLGGIQDTKLQQSKENLEKIDAEIHNAKNQLDFYRDQSAKKDLGLQTLFDELVRRVLKADYSGSIITSSDDFAPQIRRGNVITGAAVESLSFVLMDITSMLAPAKGIGQHPGFLVHDSPREADLDIAPYHSFLSELATITGESGGAQNASFQYIVTTTTEPPKNLETYVKLSLAAYPADRMLFGQQLEENNLLTEN